MKRISREQADVCEIDHRLTPAIRVAPGERFILETEDAAAGFFRNESTLPYPEDRPTHTATPPRLNPVAGPVYIDGAKKGDVVAVSIERIVPDTQGYTILQPGDGLLGDSLQYRSANEFYTKIFRHIPGVSDNHGECIFTDRLRWPLHPFIGTITLAPEREVLASVSVQGPWGGNLDVRDICEGSKVFFNSYVDGGFLFAGDVHGCQGDGELSGTADETRAELTLCCEVIKDKRIPHVRIEKPDSIIGLGTGKPLESAVKTAFLNLLEWITGEYGIPERDAYIFLATCPDFRINIYQMVDLAGLDFTAGAEIPKRYLS